MLEINRKHDFERWWHIPRIISHLQDRWSRDSMIKSKGERNGRTWKLNECWARAPGSCFANSCVNTIAFRWRFNCNASLAMKNPPGETKERLPAFNGLTTHGRIGMNGWWDPERPIYRPTPTRPIARVFVAFKNKTYASLKPLTCSILICLTIVLLPDSPAPETGGENRTLLIPSSSFCRFCRGFLAGSATFAREMTRV